MCHPSSKTDRHETRVELRGVRSYLPLAARAESSAVPYLSLPMLRRHCTVRGGRCLLLPFYPRWSLWSVRLPLPSLPD